MNLSGLLLASALRRGCNGPDKRGPQPTYRPGTTTIGPGSGQPPVFPGIGGPGSMNAGGAAGAPQGQGGMIDPRFNAPNNLTPTNAGLQPGGPNSIDRKSTRL